MYPSSWHSQFPDKNISFATLFSLRTRCADVWPEVITTDTVTNLARATHPSRSFYYTFVSIVLYFFPIVVMSFAYCFIILKLSQRPPGEYVDSDACVQIKVKRKVRQSLSFKPASRGHFALAVGVVGNDFKINIGTLT